MKTIPKSAAPPSLQTWVDANPDETWDALSNERALRDELCGQLMIDQGGLCAYCEIDLVLKAVDGLDDFRVEHFVPKKPQIPATPINYALHWPNLLAVCHGGSRSWLASHIKDRHTSPDHCCDVPKGDNNWLGIILDPQTIPAFPALFAFIEQGAQAGQINVADTCPKELKEQAANSIEKLRLNARRLSTRRKPVIDALRENVEVLLAQGYELEAAMQELAQSQLRKSASQCWPKYFSCIRWYLGSHAEDQLRRIDYQG
jgi:uncharacterized protein (TIGR02646 family)